MRSATLLPPGCAFVCIRMYFGTPGGGVLRRRGTPLDCAYGTNGRYSGTAGMRGALCGARRLQFRLCCAHIRTFSWYSWAVQRLVRSMTLLPFGCTSRTPESYLWHIWAHLWHGRVVMHLVRSTVRRPSGCAVCTLGHHFARLDCEAARWYGWAVICAQRPTFVRGLRLLVYMHVVLTCMCVLMRDGALPLYIRTTGPS